MELITKTNLTGTRQAVFSPCETYRYRLHEVFKPNPRPGQILRTQAFLMLNPSTANEMVDDPTVARCHKRAIAMGFEKFEVINIFALRSTDPKGLYNHPDPVGPDNNDAILACAKEAVASGGQVICAWGNHGLFATRAEEVLGLLRTAGIPLFALKTNRNGSPAHPLYLKDSLIPAPYAY